MGPAPRIANRGASLLGMESLPLFFRPWDRTPVLSKSDRIGVLSHGRKRGSFFPDQDFTLAQGYQIAAVAPIATALDALGRRESPGLELLEQQGHEQRAICTGE